ncbi:MAG: hypothetical protein R3F59_13460 [Myxococcota bacterium]
MMLEWLALVEAVAHAADGADVDAADAAAPAPAPPTLEEKYPVRFPGQVRPGEPNFDLEVVYYEGRFEDGLAEVERRLAQAPSPQLYWMKVRFMYEIGEKFDPKDTSIDRLAFYQEMADAVEAGLALAPTDRHLLFARGVALGRLGTTRGVLSSLFMAKDVEQSWLAVANDKAYQYSSIGGHEVLPCDAFHALGIYYRLVPDWWIVQVIAGTRGNLEKSVEWHTKATRCKPDEVANWKELGATQLCLGQHDKDQAMIDAGMASLQKGASLPTGASERKRIDQRHAKAMMADPSLACGYSRDGQQDLDEKKLKARGK